MPSLSRLVARTYSMRLLGNAMLVLFVVACAPVIPVLSTDLRLSAAEPQGPNCSVERFRMLLQEIDPYLPGKPVTGEISIFGSSMMDGLANSWIHNFRDYHPKASFKVESLKEPEAAERMVERKSGIWLVSRPVSHEELDDLRSKGLQDPVAFEVAKEALGVFVHNSNPVASISGEQLRAIFSADASQELTWLALGATGQWADNPIQIVGRKDESGTQRFLERFVLQQKMRRDTVVESNYKVVDAIQENPFSIGICGLKCGINQARALSLEANNTTIPSDDLAILTGQYPLIRPLSIVVDLGNAENREAIEFLRYVFSQSGQAENILSGYFPMDLPLIRAKLDRLETVVSD